MPDPTPIERAEDAVCDAIAKQAGDAGRKPDELKQLAEGVAAMKHGPQGGDYHNTYAGTYSSRSDEHRTDHQGEDRPRPRAGF